MKLLIKQNATILNMRDIIINIIILKHISNFVMNQLNILMLRHIYTKIYVMNIVQRKLLKMIQMEDAHAIIIYIM